MSTKPEPFADNWAYLKTELNWLDRVLMVAVARQRQDTKHLDRIAQSRADRVSSHWWKGIVSLDGKVAYDEHRTATSSSQPRVGYQQQLDARIKLSHQQGIMLALPLLRDRLQLSAVEKNIVLMSLAPEVNRRYARLYRYLQGEEHSKTDLPTVDLVLKLLCRNDQEWRNARMQLSADSVLVQQQLLTLVADSSETFLNASLKLSERLVDYLLAQAPTPQTLDSLLTPTPTAPWAEFSSGLTAPSSSPVFSSALSAIPAISQPPVTPHSDTPTANHNNLEQPRPDWPTWADLIVPDSLQIALKSLCAQVTPQPTLNDVVDQDMASDASFVATHSDMAGMPAGAIAILVGASGTGKTMAARAIAQTLHLPLHWLDLATIHPHDFEDVVHDLKTKHPRLLLIKSAEHWLKRSSSLSNVALQQLITHRQQRSGLTLFSVERLEAIHLRWRRQLSQMLLFPMPDAAARAQIWQTALAAHLTQSSDIDCNELAQQYVLTGGDIVAIARSVIQIAAVEHRSIKMIHLHQALQQHGKYPKRRSPLTKKTNQQSKRRRRSSKSTP